MLWKETGGPVDALWSLVWWAAVLIGRQLKLKGESDESSRDV